MKKKRKYVKPEVTEIKLDVKCAVLGFCKISGDDGASGDGYCGETLHCFDIGS